MTDSVVESRSILGIAALTASIMLAVLTARLIQVGYAPAWVDSIFAFITGFLSMVAIVCLLGKEVKP